MGSRRCRTVHGSIACGGAPTAADRAEVLTFKRYLAGEMDPVEKRAYEGLDGGGASDLQRVARMLAIGEGRGTPAQAREAAGLSVGQAAKLLEWLSARLRSIEAGEAMSSGERAKLLDLYGVQGFADDGAVEVPRG